MRHEIRIPGRAGLEVFSGHIGLFLPRLRKAIDKGKLKLAARSVTRHGKTFVQHYWVSASADEPGIGVHAADRTTSYVWDPKKGWDKNLVDFMRVRAKEVLGVEFTSTGVAEDPDLKWAYGVHRWDGSVGLNPKVWAALHAGFATADGSPPKAVEPATARALKTWLHEELHGAGIHKVPNGPNDYYIKDDTGRVLQEGPVELLSHLTISRFFAPLFHITGEIGWTEEPNPLPPVEVTDPTGDWLVPYQGRAYLTPQDRADLFPDMTDEEMLAAGWTRDVYRHAFTLKEDKYSHRAKWGKPDKSYHYRANSLKRAPDGQEWWVFMMSGQEYGFNAGNPWAIDWNNVSYDREVSLTIHLVSLMAGHAPEDQAARVDTDEAMERLKDLCYRWPPLERATKIAEHVCDQFAPEESEYRRNLRVKAVAGIIHGAMENEKYPHIVAKGAHSFASYHDEDDDDDDFTEYMNEVLAVVRDKVRGPVLDRRIRSTMSGWGFKRGQRFHVGRYGRDAFGTDIARHVEFDPHVPAHERHDLRTGIAKVVSRMVANYSFLEDAGIEVNPTKLHAELVTAIHMDHNHETLAALDAMVPDLEQEWADAKHVSAVDSGTRAWLEQRLAGKKGVIDKKAVKQVKAKAADAQSAKLKAQARQARGG